MRWSSFDIEAQHVILDARRRATGAGPGVIGSGHLLAACLADPSVVEVLTAVGIVHGDASSRLGVPAPFDRSELLGLIGIDVVPAPDAAADPREVPWRPRRGRTRPLRISLEAPSSCVRFAGSGRKVLEVAVWIAKRHLRQVSSLDLLRGVLSDGCDPVISCLTRDEFAMRRLIVMLHEIDEYAA
jgi:hypothetical protein